MKEDILLTQSGQGKGIGFYENEGFYPDFILWTSEDAKQRIVFIEPHGMEYEVIREDNPKINFFKKLRKISHERFGSKNFHMGAFIISTTEFIDFRSSTNMNRQDFATLHILFRKAGDPTYLSPIFQESN